MKKTVSRLISFIFALMVVVSSIPVQSYAMTDEDLFEVKDSDTEFLKGSRDGATDYLIPESQTIKDQPIYDFQDDPDEYADSIDPLYAASDHTADDAINWASSKVGQAIDLDGNGAWCVDLIVAYQDYLGVGRVWGNGRDYAWNALPAGWSRYQNGAPQKGDILVYTGGDYGHVCIYESDYVTYHQRYRGAYVSRETGYYRNTGSGYWGCIRPNFKANVPTGVAMGKGIGRIIPDGDYHLVSAVDPSLNTMLDVPGDNFDEADGTQASIWANFGNLYDVFTLQFKQTDGDGSGYYTIQHKGSNKRLDVYGAGLARNCKVQYWEANDSVAQDWALSYAGGGWYYLQSRCNSYYLDVSGGSSANGTSVGLWDRNETNAQKWAFVPVLSDRSIENGNYRILYAKDTTKSVGIVDDANILDEVYNNAVLVENDFNRNNVFSLKYYSNKGVYQIQQKSSGRNLDVQKGGSTNNVGVWVGEEDGTPNGRWQEWAIIKNGDNYNIVSRFMGTYLDAANASSDIGTNIQLYESNLTIAQQWKFVRAVDDIQLSKSEISIVEDENITLTASVLPAEAENKSVSWASSNESVATVNSNGLITACGVGSAVITATTVDGKYTDTCDVRVVAKDQDEDKDKDNDKEKEQETKPQEQDTDPKTDDSDPTKTEDNAPVVVDDAFAVGQKVSISQLFGKSYAKYAVEPKGYASVSSKGLLTAKKAGSVNVVGLIKSGKKWVRDTDNAIEIEIEKPSFEEKTVLLSYAGETFDANDNLEATSCVPSSWATSNAKVLTIDKETGLITAEKSGTAKVSAVFGEGKNAAKYSFTIKVTVPVISKKTVTMLTGASTTIKLNKASDAPDWSSSDESVAEVDENGKITAHNAGEAEIIAQLNGIDYSCKVTVKKPTLSIKKVALVSGKTKKIALKNSKLTDVEWESSDDGIATVDENGVITAIAPGQVEISTSAGGCEDICVVTVK